MHQENKYDHDLAIHVTNNRWTTLWRPGLLTRPWAHEAKAEAEARKSEAEVEAEATESETEAKAEASHHEAEAKAKAEATN